MFLKPLGIQNLIQSKEPSKNHFSKKWLQINVIIMIMLFLFYLLFCFCCKCYTRFLAPEETNLVLGLKYEKI